jgi:hypothetical protein
LVFLGENFAKFSNITILNWKKKPMLASSSVLVPSFITLSFGSKSKMLKWTIQKINKLEIELLLQEKKVFYVFLKS